jgi:2-keto-3-deoxy-galactonokinase
VAVDSQDNIIVADWGNSRIQVSTKRKFQDTGQYKKEIPGYRSVQKGNSRIQVSTKGIFQDTVQLQDTSQY